MRSLIIVILLNGVPLVAQFKAGTVVVLSVSQQRVIVGADSRAISEGDPPNDQVCKIVALNDHLLFVGSGLDGEEHTQLTSLNWSVRTEAVRALSKVLRAKAASSDDLVEAVSTAWTKLVRKRYAESEKRMLPELLRNREGDVLLDAVFVGLGNDKIKIVEDVVTFDRVKAERHGFAPIEITPQSWQIPEQPTLKAIGHPEIAVEFSGQSSPRAIAEAQRWNVEIFRHPTNDPEALKVSHLVDLSAKYAPYGWGIGGEVDEVELTPQHGIHWLKLKNGCQEKGVLH